MKIHEFDYIAKTSNINKKTCTYSYDGYIITYFKFDHKSGNSLIGRIAGKPLAYDIAAQEGEFLSVKIVQIKDTVSYIKKVFSWWEEEDAKKSTLS